MNIHQGLELYQVGQYRKALEVFDRILKRDSFNPDALHLSGLALMQLDEPVKAVEYIRKAVKKSPRTANFHNSLGMACQKSGRWEDASRSFKKTIELDPRSLFARLNLGNALKESGDLKEAIRVYRDALKLDPNFPDTRYNLANILKEDGQFPEAIGFYLSLLAPFPELISLVREGQSLDSANLVTPNEPRTLHAQALNNLCILLIEQKRTDEAIGLLEIGIRYAPEHYLFHLNLAMAHADINQWEQSLEASLTALELNPADASACFNAGRAYQNMGMCSEAVTYYHKAIQYDPTHFKAYNNSGQIYLEAKQFDEARAAFEKALELSPDTDEITANLACLAVDQGELEKAKSLYQKLADKNPDDQLLKLRLMSFCPDLIHSKSEIIQYRSELSEKVRKMDPNLFVSDIQTLSQKTTVPPYNLQFHGMNDRELKEQYAEIYRTIISSYGLKPECNTEKRTGKPRIGFLMTSGHEGAFNRFIGGVLNRLDYSQFDPYVFCGGPTLPKLKADLACDEINYVTVPFRLDHAVQVLKETKLDLLYHWEVGSDTLNYLIPFFAPARKQVVSMGLPVTTGIKEMDYFLTSSLVEPEDFETHYTEKPLMGETLLSWQIRRQWNRHENIVEELGLSSQNHLYLCGHKIQKFHPDFDEVLAEILDADSKGLVLVPGDTTGKFSPALYQRFHNQYPDLSGRLKILPKLNYEKYFSLIEKCDVLLDPLHYGGGLSSYDGFSSNKLIVTKPGEFHRGRYTAAFYHRMGLSSLVTGSIEEYVSLAVRAGTDRDFRIELEQKIEEVSPVLFENQEVVREYQQIFEKLIYG